MSNPPGWYPSAAYPGQLRWWDGTQWGTELRPAAAAPSVFTPQVATEQPTVTPAFQTPTFTPQPATPSIEPTPARPRKWLTAAVAAVAGLAVGVGGTLGVQALTGTDEPTPASAPRDRSTAKDTESPSDTSPNPPPATEAEPPALTPPEGDNSDATQVTLGPGMYTVGQDLGPGRYTITFEGTDAGFTVTNEANGTHLYESVGGPNTLHTVPSITVTLWDGDNIDQGAKTAVFTPVKRELRTTLTTGAYTVGLDIEPGEYMAYPEPSTESGNFAVYDAQMNLTVNQILGPQDTPEYKVRLETGGGIDISHLPAVRFEPVAS